MRRTGAVLVLILGVSGGCRRDEDASGQPVKPAAPEAPEPERRSFLKEPAGVPPDPLVPKLLEIEVRAATDVSALRLDEVQGKTRVVRSEGPEVAAFLKAYAAWYAPLDAPADATMGVAPELGMAFPAARVALAGTASLRRQELLALVAQGARGNLILWFDVMAMRSRLTGGGVTGAWRGITRLRDDIPGEGPKLGGTPVLRGAAIAALDVPLLPEPLPSPFRALVTEDACLGPKREHEARRSRVGKAGPDAKVPTLESLPVAWRGAFEAPDGTRVAWLLPASTDALAGALDATTEALVPVLKQGGKAWVLVALPLAEEYLPEGSPTR